MEDVRLHFSVELEQLDHTDRDVVALLAAAPFQVVSLHELAITGTSSPGALADHLRAHLTAVVPQG